MFKFLLYTVVPVVIVERIDYVICSSVIQYMINLLPPKVELMDRIIRHFSQQSNFSLLFRAYVSIFIIAAIDFYTGPFVSMLVFYLIPIIITSWFVNKRSGLLISVISAIGCSLHDILFFPISPSDHLVSKIALLWNPLISLSVFIIVVLIISALRKREEEKLKFELKVAVEVQSSLLPRTHHSLKTLSYTASCKPSSVVSGDYYDFLILDNHTLGIAIGDIAGKGISAALIMANLQGLLRSYAYYHGENISDMMGVINNSLYECTDANNYATLFYGFYDDTNKTLTYVNAGHNPPILLRNRNGYIQLNSIDLVNTKRLETKVIKMNHGGTIIGAFPNVSYKHHQVMLQSGDVMIFFTDGLIDARNFIHEQYGEDRLIALVSSNLHESSQTIHDIIMDEINQFIGTSSQFDDITLIVAKVN